MKKRNKELLDIYMRGFNDELDPDSKQLTYIDKIDNNAYQLGRMHSYMGDELSNIDKLSDKKILKLIK